MKNLKLKVVSTKIENDYPVIITELNGIKYKVEFDQDLTPLNADLTKIITMGFELDFSELKEKAIEMQSNIEDLLKVEKQKEIAEHYNNHYLTNLHAEYDAKEFGVSFELETKERYIARNENGFYRGDPSEKLIYRGYTLNGFYNSNYKNNFYIDGSLNNYRIARYGSFESLIKNFKKKVDAKIESILRAKKEKLERENVNAAQLLKLQNLFSSDIELVKETVYPRYQGSSSYEVFRFVLKLNTQEIRFSENRDGTFNMGTFKNLKAQQVNSILAILNA